MHTGPARVGAQPLQVHHRWARARPTDLRLSKSAMSEPESWLTPVGVRLLCALVGRNLRRERERAAMTRQDLCRASGVAVSTIQRLESGESDPRLTSLIALASGLGVPLEALLAGWQRCLSAD